jgi:hypothetical protein
MVDRPSDFIQSVKDLLAFRAGHRCSYPGCAAPTSGPSAEKPTAKANTGKGCHIMAASGGPGARRVDPTMSVEELKQVSNGIWMCCYHADLIDKDEVRFTKELLQQWRSRAERQAAILQGASQVEHPNTDLFNWQVTIDQRNLFEGTVADAFDDAGVSAYWGSNEAPALRDFVFEVAQNALTHGKATAVELQFAAKSIRITNDGYAFPVNRLAASGRGGGRSLNALRRVLGDRLNLKNEISEKGNSLVLQMVRSLADLSVTGPCVLDAMQIFTDTLVPELAEFDGCEAIFIVLPPFMAFSKVRCLEDYLMPLKLSKQIILVAEGVSDDVASLLEAIPRSRLLRLPARQRSI